MVHIVLREGALERERNVVGKIAEIKIPAARQAGEAVGNVRRGAVGINRGEGNFRAAIGVGPELGDSERGETVVLRGAGSVLKFLEVRPAVGEWMRVRIGRAVAGFPPIRNAVAAGAGERVHQFQIEAIRRGAGTLVHGEVGRSRRDDAGGRAVHRHREQAAIGGRAGERDGIGTDEQSVVERLVRHGEAVGELAVVERPERGGERELAAVRAGDGPHEVAGGEEVELAAGAVDDLAVEDRIRLGDLRGGEQRREDGPDERGAEKFLHKFFHNFGGVDNQLPE